MNEHIKTAILNNIVREVEAIRGYIADPVEGDFIKDEIKHIEELCLRLRIACYSEADEYQAEKVTEEKLESDELEPNDDEYETEEEDDEY